MDSPKIEKLKIDPALPHCAAKCIAEKVDEIIDMTNTLNPAGVRITETFSDPIYFDEAYQNKVAPVGTGVLVGETLYVATGKSDPAEKWVKCGRFGTGYVDVFVNIRSDGTYNVSKTLEQIIAEDKKGNIVRAVAFGMEGMDVGYLPLTCYNEQMAAFSTALGNTLAYLYIYESGGCTFEMVQLN